MITIALAVYGEVEAEFRSCPATPGTFDATVEGGEAYCLPSPWAAIFRALGDYLDGQLETVARGLTE